MFEDEYYELKRRPLNVERLTMDASVLLPPTGTPLTGIEFGKRLPSGEVRSTFFKYFTKIPLSRVVFMAHLFFRASAQEEP